MKTYEQMLDEALKNLPETSIATQRFEIPKAKGFLQGNKTVVTNFKEIVDAFRRDAQHFLKYLLKELASPGILDGPRLVLGRKVSSSLINAKIKHYADHFVLCSTCGKPDTQVIMKGDSVYLKCAACGAQKPVKL
ncbi:translation initiation factor IF-2 subunit beta [Candidatus Woesearchaeota archaeon]|nr:translation initiation factor IF-2 subunit beta [Candidatus Woesearchaeota archaeon]